MTLNGAGVNSTASVTAGVGRSVFDFSGDNITLDASETYTATLSGNFANSYAQGDATNIGTNSDATFAAVVNALPDFRINADPSTAPVPEPSSALLLFGGGLIACARRRRG